MAIYNTQSGKNIVNFEICQKQKFFSLIFNYWGKSQVVEIGKAKPKLWTSYMTRDCLQEGCFVEI